MVDDDRDLCDLLSDFLADEGYAVSRAYGGQDAIDSARDSPPDAVLLDLGLPDVSGVSVGRALREAAPTHTVPIVIISGDPAALARGTAVLGAHSCLEKPFSLDAGQTAVRAALGPRSGALGSA